MLELFSIWSGAGGWAGRYRLLEARRQVRTKQALHIWGFALKHIAFGYQPPLFFALCT